MICSIPDTEASINLLTTEASKVHLCIAWAKSVEGKVSVFSPIGPIALRVERMNSNDAATETKDISYVHSDLQLVHIDTVLLARIANMGIELEGGWI